MPLGRNRPFRARARVCPSEPDGRLGFANLSIRFDEVAGDCRVSFDLGKWVAMLIEIGNSDVSSRDRLTFGVRFSGGVWE